MGNKYENIEDFLGLGKHILKLEPQEIWDKEEGKFQRGTQRTGVSRTGNKWWMYSVKDHKDSQGHRFKVLAFDLKQKELFDGGVVEINILPGKNFDLNEQGNPYQDETGEFVKKKKAFFNPISDYEMDKINDEKAIERVGNKIDNSEITIDDIASMF
jgi:hypothetical protein